LEKGLKTRAFSLLLQNIAWTNSIARPFPGTCFYLCRNQTTNSGPDFLCTVSCF